METFHWSLDLTLSILGVRTCSKLRSETPLITSDVLQVPKYLRISLRESVIYSLVRVDVASMRSCRMLFVVSDELGG